MLIVALVLAVIGLAALVTAVVSSNEIVAWVCIGVSAIGVILLVVDAVRDRQRRAAATAALAGTSTETIEFEESPIAEEGVAESAAVDVGPVSEARAETETDTEIEIEAETETETEAEGVTAEVAMTDSGGAEESAEIVAEDHPEEVVHDEPEFDTYSDDEPEYPPSAEESALHAVDESDPDTVDESDLNSDESEQR
jgi:hypothetical protein